MSTVVSASTRRLTLVHSECECGARLISEDERERLERSHFLFAIRRPSGERQPFVKLRSRRLHPDTKKRVTVSCKPHTHVDCLEVRRLAKAEHRTLSSRLEQVANGISAAVASGLPTSARYPLAQACEDYLHVLETTNSQKFNGRMRRPKSIKKVESILQELLDWAAKCEPPVTRACDVSERTLIDWNAYVSARPSQRDGKPRKPSSVDFDRKWVRLFMRWLIWPARLASPALSDIAVRQLLKPVTAQRALEIVWHGVTETEATLTAAIALDDTERFARPCACDVALAYLLGTRLQECVLLKCGDVQLMAASKWNKRKREPQVSLRAEITKGSIARVVPLAGFSDMAVELLSELTRGRDPDEWLFMSSYQQLADRLRDMRTQHGAPASTSARILRTSYCNYTAALKHIDVDTKDKAAGHTRQVAANRYIDGANIPPAPSLERAMQATKLIRTIIARLRAWNRANPEVKRTEWRCPLETPETVRKPRKGIRGAKRAKTNQASDAS